MCVHAVGMHDVCGLYAEINTRSKITTYKLRHGKFILRRVLFYKIKKGSISSVIHHFNLFYSAKQLYKDGGFFLYESLHREIACVAHPYEPW